MKTANRLTPIPTSIFSTMTKLAFEHDAVNLGQGFPDFDGPEWLHKQAFKAMQEGKNQYAPSQGILSLRKAISKIEKDIYCLEYDPENEITITTGATEALYCAITAIIDPGDEVIVFEPFYDSYHADIILAGGVIKYITLALPDFSFNPDDLEKAVSSKTKMIIINNPHNPSGKVFTKDELESIAKVAIKHDLVVLSDEVYEFLTYDDAVHIPMATIAGMKSRTITTSSTGKTFGMTGWKLGYAKAPADLTEAIRKVHQWTTFAVNTPVQHAMRHGFENLHDYLPEFKELYQKKRDFLYKELENSLFKPHLPMGSYFIMANIPEGLYNDDVHCSEELVKKHRLAVIPPSPFYNKSDDGKKMIRFCFAKKEETLREGVKFLRNIGTEAI